MYFVSKGSFLISESIDLNLNPFCVSKKKYPAVDSSFDADAGTDFEAGGSLVFAQEQDSVGGGFDSGQCFQGDLGFVRIYDRALEANEIKQNFLSQKSRFGL